MNEFDAYWHQTPAKVASNLENTHEENIAYLGTYFPRTAIESHSISRHLLETMPAVRAAIAGKEVIRVLDYGCGTGGELLGMLSSFKDILKDDMPKVEVHAVDGNEDALAIMLRVMEMSREHVGDVKVEAQHFEFRKTFLNKSLGDSYDVIMTSKFLSEANDRFPYPYALFAWELLPRLAPDGIAVFLDVTNRQSDERGGKWANLQMNEELDAFRQCHAEFRTCPAASCAETLFGRR